MTRCVVWTLAFSWACQAQDAANPATAGDDDPQLAAVALAFVLVPTLIYFVRRRQIGRIKQQMLLVSTSEPDGDDAEDGCERSR